MEVSFEGDFKLENCKVLSLILVEGNKVRTRNHYDTVQ